MRVSDDTATRLSRRHLLTWLAGGGVAVAAGAFGALELAAHDVIPGHSIADVVLGYCDVAAPPMRFAMPGPSYSRSFASTARGVEVGFTVAYPPGHSPGDELPLVVMLHGEGANHTTALSGVRPAQAVAWELTPALRPMALATVDGSHGYWNPHPGDDPMRMVVEEFVPMLQRRGLGRDAVGLMGISMGGYGALEIAARNPGFARAVAAISPAIWTSYAQALSVNPRAYADADAFDAADAVTLAPRLAHTPVRVASGNLDPFRPGVLAFLRALPSAVSELSSGCHTGPFFLAQEPPSLQFLSDHLG